MKNKYYNILIFIGILIGAYFLNNNSKMASIFEGKSVQSKNKKNLHPVKEKISLESTSNSLDEVFVPPEVDTEKEQLTLIDRSQLVSMVGNFDAKLWRDKYELAKYEAVYDLTWKADMYNRTFDLIFDEKYTSKIEMDNAECVDELCKFKLRQLSESKESLAVTASDFILDLKNHPAILNSGKKRNVYIRSINITDEGSTFDIEVF